MSFMSFWKEVIFGSSQTDCVDNTSHEGTSSPDVRLVRLSLADYVNWTNMLPDNYVVFDLETTGLNPCMNEVVEIGAIKYINHTESERFSTYIKPIVPITDEVTSINHITNQMLRSAPTIDQVSNDFLEFIKGYTLVAHNAQFDMSFIQTRQQFHLSNDVVDTLKLSRQCIGGVPNYKLESLNDYLKIDVQSHSAIGDCLVTAALYQHCFEPLPDKEEVMLRRNSFDTSKLDDVARQYFDAFISILEKEGKDIGDIDARCYGDSVTISFNAGIPIYIVKYGGRLKYWHSLIPFSNFQIQYATCAIKTTPAPKSDGGADVTRIFLNSPQDLGELKDLVISQYENSAQYLKPMVRSSAKNSPFIKSPYKCKLCDARISANNMNFEFHLCAPCMLSVNAYLEKMQQSIAENQNKANAETNLNKKIGYLNAMLVQLQEYKTIYFDNGIDILKQDIITLIATVEECIAENLAE